MVTRPGRAKCWIYTTVKAAMAIDYDIPFIAGEMLHGGNCEGHNALVRQVPSLEATLIMSPPKGWSWRPAMNGGFTSTMTQSDPADATVRNETP